MVIYNPLVVINFIIGQVDGIGKICVSNLDNSRGNIEGSNNSNLIVLCNGEE